MAQHAFDEGKAASANAPRTLGAGYFFGIPMGDLGWFTSLLMGLATGMAAFFLATFLGIVSILLLNSLGHRVDYAWSYTRVGLPVGLLVAVLALGYLATMWVKRITRRA